MLSDGRGSRAPVASTVHLSWAHSSQLHLLVLAPEPIAHDGGGGAASTSLGGSSMKSSIPTFPTLLQRFFTQRLMQQKRVSAHTISSYLGIDAIDHPATLGTAAARSIWM